MNMHRHQGIRIPALSAPVAILISAVTPLFRGLIPGVARLSCLVGLIGSANAAVAVVPLVTAHHHWFVWLPRHPVYESVEIMSIDSANSFYRAVWVFFTERRGGNHQVHYFDDRQIVGYFPGSHHRPIHYERSGAPGQGQSVRVALTGLDDVPIEIVVDLADRPLTRTGAGLTNQSGHSADTLFLLFHRDHVAFASDCCKGLLLPRRRRSGSQAPIHGRLQHRNSDRDHSVRAMVVHNARRAAERSRLRTVLRRHRT